MSSVKGVIAAGHPATAEAGKQILEAGGNAIDAAIAAGFTACVAEPLLTSLGGGGFMLVHDAKAAKQTLFDFFVTMPGQQLASDRRISGMVPTPVDFGGTVQMFHGGHATIAVPGVVAGLCAVHRSNATMPLTELVQPAMHYAKKGVVQTKQQEYLNIILSGVAALSGEMDVCFKRDGRLLVEGDTFYNPDVAPALEDIARTSGDSFYKGDIAAAIIQEMEKGGGLITSKDLAGYTALKRRPVVSSYRHTKVVTNPPPSSGGALIAHSLALLQHFELANFSFGSYDYIQHVVEAMMATNEIRRERFDAFVRETDILDRLLAEEVVTKDHSRFRSRLGNTTHLSVIDAVGNAVSMTSSNGSGSGIAVPGTGIFLNNILGEEDLNPNGFYQHPVGERLTSMMAPTLLIKENVPRLAIGSAGSNRIRSAVLQVALGIIDFGFDVKKAIEAPRLHCEDDIVEVEAGFDTEAVDQLSQAGYKVNIWKEKNLFFGGAQGVERDPETGQLSGAGDSRRGGVAATAH